jgi:TonB family protein
MKRFVWFSITLVSLASAPFDLEGQPPYRIGNGVSPPTVLHKVEPEYSEEAKRAGLEGTVILYLVVDEKGNPRDIRPIRTLGKGLDEKAIEAVKQWKFRPGMRDRQAVAVQCTIEVNFRGASAEVSRNGLPHPDESGDRNPHPMNVGDSSGGNLSTALRQGSLLGGKDLPAGSGTLSAPGYGKHSYVFRKLDLGGFAYGGTLVIEIIAGHKKVEASFDLFPDGTSLDFTGYAPEHGPVAHVWSVPRDSTVHLVHKFDRGGVFVLGAEGSWYAKEGSSNDFRYSARVYENMDSLIRRGAALNASDVADLEEKTRRAPDDMASRTTLVAYYSTQPSEDSEICTPRPVLAHSLDDQERFRIERFRQRWPLGFQQSRRSSGRQSRLRSGEGIMVRSDQAAC